MEANGGVGDGNSFAPPGLLASIGAIRVFRRGLSQLITINPLTSALGFVLLHSHPTGIPQKHWGIGRF